jgi:hypothetical protein
LQHLHTLSVQNFRFVPDSNGLSDLEQLPETITTTTTTAAAVGNGISDQNNFTNTISIQSSSSNCGGSLLTACIPVPLLCQLHSLQLQDLTTPDLQQLTYLSCAAHLTLLRLSHIKDRAWEALHPSTGSELLSAIIPQLMALKDLSFNLSAQFPALASISHLQQLESLQLPLEPWTDTLKLQTP